MSFKKAKEPKKSKKPSKLNKEISFGSIGKKKKRVTRSNVPVKRTINLITVGQKPFNKKAAIPGIILVIILAAAFAKFGVVDRLAAAEEAESRVQVLQSQVDACYEAIDEYGDIAEEYAHYTYSGMTQEELTRTDRMKVLALIDRRLLSEAQVNTWTISGNQLNAVISGSTLQKINEIVQALQKEKMVEYCSVTTAATGSDGMAIKNTDIVTANITVYFNII